MIVYQQVGIVVVCGVLLKVVLQVVLVLVFVVVCGLGLSVVVGGVKYRLICERFVSGEVVKQVRKMNRFVQICIFSLWIIQVMVFLFKFFLKVFIQVEKNMKRKGSQMRLVLNSIDMMVFVIDQLNIVVKILRQELSFMVCFEFLVECVGFQWVFLLSQCSSMVSFIRVKRVVRQLWVVWEIWVGSGLKLWCVVSQLRNFMLCVQIRMNVMVYSMMYSGFSQWSWLGSCCMLVVWGSMNSLVSIMVVIDVISRSVQISV